MSKSNKKSWRILYTIELRQGVTFLKADTEDEARAEFQKQCKGATVLMITEDVRDPPSDKPIKGFFR